MEINATRRQLIAAEEEDKVARKCLIWLNTFAELPVPMVRYEMLEDDGASMALSTIPGSYITRKYIWGGHRAEYQFKVIYRLKPGTSMDKRLKADELLNRLGDWARTNWPDLGEGITVRKVEPTTRAEYFTAYDNGDEDHQIFITVTYEVI